MQIINVIVRTTGLATNVNSVKTVGKEQTVTKKLRNALTLPVQIMASVSKADLIIGTVDAMTAGKVTRAKYQRVIANMVIVICRIRAFVTTFGPVKSVILQSVKKTHAPNRFNVLIKTRPVSFASAQRIFV